MSSGGDLCMCWGGIWGGGPEGGPLRTIPPVGAMCGGVLPSGVGRGMVVRWNKNGPNYT